MGQRFRKSDVTLSMSPDFGWRNGIIGDSNSYAEDGQTRSVDLHMKLPTSSSSGLRNNSGLFERDLSMLNKQEKGGSDANMKSDITINYLVQVIIKEDLDKISEKLKEDYVLDTITTCKLKFKEREHSWETEMDILQFCVLRQRPRALKRILDTLNDYRPRQVRRMIEDNHVFVREPKIGIINSDEEDPQLHNQNIFHLAANGSIECLKILINKMKDNKKEISEAARELCKAKDKLGRTPIHIAAANSNVECFDELFDCLDDELCLIDKDKLGDTPLHDAVKSGPIESTFSILTKITKNLPKDCVNETNKKGRSPIFYAKENRSLYALLISGADPTFLDKEGKSLLEHFLRTNPDNARALMNYDVNTNGKESTDRDFLYTYNFRLFLSSERAKKKKEEYEEDNDEAEEMNKSKKEDFPRLESKIISKICEYQQQNLLSAPAAGLYVFSKWSIPRYLYYAYVGWYIVYLVALTSVVFWTSYEINHPNADYDSCRFDGLNFHIYENKQRGHNFWHTLFWATYVFTMLVSAKWVWKLFPPWNWNNIRSDIISYIISYIPEFFRIFCSCFYLNYGKFTNDVNCNVQLAFGALALFLSWVELSFLIGRTPKLGIFIVISKSVLKQLIQFLIVYVPTLIAFACTFSVILPTSEIFQNLFTSVLKVFVMMVGEFDFEDNFTADGFSDKSKTFRILVTMFIFLICVLVVNFLGNLMLGLVIENISDMQKEAETLMTKETLEHVQETENFFFHRKVSNILWQVIKKLTCNTSQLELLPYLEKRCKKQIEKSQVVICMKPNESVPWWKPFTKNFYAYNTEDKVEQTRLNIKTPEWLLKNTRAAVESNKKVRQEVDKGYKEYDDSLRKKREESISKDFGSLCKSCSRRISVHNWSSGSQVPGIPGIPQVKYSGDVAAGSSLSPR